MKIVFKYGIVLLAILVMGNMMVKAQVGIKHQGHLKQEKLKKGEIKVDEVEPVIVDEMIIPVLFNHSHNPGNTSLLLTKDLENLSYSKRFFFNVEKEYTVLHFNLFCEVSDGSVSITLYKPDNKILKEFKVEPGKSQQWIKSYKLKEVEDPNFIGKWTVELSCNKAYGYYVMQSRSR